MSSSFAGLQILYTLLQNVSAEEAAAQSFYQTYFCDILQHIFSVVTDTSHTAGKEIMKDVSSHNYKGFSVWPLYKYNNDAALQPVFYKTSQ